MRKFLLLTSLALVFILFGQTRLAAQAIQMQNTNNTPANPRSICQCDTLGSAGSQGVPEVRYGLGPGFSGTDFFYEFVPGTNFSTGPVVDLDLVELTQFNNVTPVDTFGVGTKWADLAIPCNFPVGSAALRIRNSNGEISDTLYYVVNKIPDEPILDSIAFGFENPYTTGVDDWGFCKGDSVYLYVEPQLGASYQWNNNGMPIAGETDDSIVIKTSGVYSVTLSLGACTRTSKDTIINAFLPPTDIILFNPGITAFQMDDPHPNNSSPVDSLQFCEDQSAILQANAPVAATGLTYDYFWLTDSITSFGDTVQYRVGGLDSIQNLTINASSPPFNMGEYNGRFYVVIYDGFCTDTSRPYFAYMDSIPDVMISSQTYENGILNPATQDVEICMTDSVLLHTPYTHPTSVIADSLEFQWQRLNTTLTPPVWEDVNTTNYDRDGDKYSLQVDTSLKPVRPLSFYRLRIWTLTPHTRTRICSYTTDSVVIRWKPKDSIRFANDPWVNVLSSSSLNFCETDSAHLIAPPIPGQMVTNGYSMMYQWLRDSTDTATGLVYKDPIPGANARDFYGRMSGAYYVAADDGICIDTLGPFTLEVDTVPATTITETRYPGQTSTPDRELCLTDSVMLSVVDTVLPGWMYQWERSLGNGNWVTQANDTLPWISVDTSYRPSGVDTLWFRVRISYFNNFNFLGCPFVSDSISVQFYNPPTLSFFPGDSLGVCAGDSILVIGQGNSQTYSWDGGTVLGPQRWLSTPGTYNLTGTGVNGCTTTRTVTIYNLQTTANAGSDITASSGEVVTLSGSGGNSYRWYADKPVAWSDFLSQSVNVSYTLPNGVLSDTITIFLEVTNAAGCTDTDQLLLIVVQEEDDDISLLSRAYNMITPNGDGINDVWDISSIVIEYNACEIEILNRWGSTVYSDETFAGGWDGNDEGGNPLPDGTYYYILSCDGSVILKNAVTIIRNQ